MQNRQKVTPKKTIFNWVQLGVLCCFALTWQTQFAAAKDVLVAASEKCPYSCDKLEGGFAVELVRRVLLAQDIESQYLEYPWARVIRESERGLIDIVPALSPRDNSSLIFSAQPVLISKACFFVNTQNQWWFSGPDSLKVISLGLVKESAIYTWDKTVNKHVKIYSSNSKRIQFSYGTNAYKKLFLKLGMGRIDAVLADINVANYIINNELESPTFQIAGCLEQSIYYYVAFNKTLPPHIKNIVDLTLERFETDTTVNELATHYDIFDIRFAGNNKTEVLR